MAPRSCASAQPVGEASGRAASPALITRRAFVGASAVALSALLVGCSSESSNVAARQIAEVPCPYNWDNLIWDGGRPVYYENDELRSQWGVDVSEHQREVDWNAVAGAGAQFAFVRIGNRGATEGKLGVDEYFLANALGAQAAGIPVSAYFFSQSIDEEEAREEAAFAIEQLREAEHEGVSFHMVAYDHEPVDIDGARANDLPPEQFSANARAFCERIAKAGFSPMIYGNQQDLLRLSVEERAEYPLWLAEYGIDDPTVTFNFAIWQYTNKGTVPGISTDADLNIWFQTS